MYSNQNHWNLDKMPEIENSKQNKSMKFLWRHIRKIFNDTLRYHTEKELKVFKMTYPRLLKEAIKPEGKKGILYLKFTSYRVELYQWALSKFNLDFNGKILEIGFGLGYLIQALAQTRKKLGATTEIYGIDHSKSMTEEASKFNADHIKEGFVSLYQSEASNMEIFKNNYFDNAVCIATAGFFQDLKLVIKEMHRVLKPEGELILVQQIHDTGRLTKDQKKNSEISNFKIFSQQELKKSFTEAGFSKVEIMKHEEKPFILLKSRK